MNLQARLTVGQAAKLLNLAKPVINNWYLRGHLKDVAFDDKGTRLYLLDELLEAERNTRHSPNSSRSLKRRGQQPIAA